LGVLSVIERAIKSCQGGFQRLWHYKEFLKEEWQISADYSQFVA